MADDLLQGHDPAQFAKRIWAVTPLSVVVVSIFLVGAYTGYWLYSQGRADERQAFEAYHELLEKR